MRPIVLEECGVRNYPFVLQIDPSWILFVAKYELHEQHGINCKAYDFVCRRMAGTLRNRIGANNNLQCRAQFGEHIS
uniref:Uncharacterized protein n=1 Tax=Physcomitrium patens TaxID=3218 RepID=A0A2K1JI32_PHYPA|nr:hypothetical protein PHYPA_018616 [Physcomitrium patens]